MINSFVVLIYFGAVKMNMLLFIRIGSDIVLA